MKIVLEGQTFFVRATPRKQRFLCFSALLVLLLVPRPAAATVGYKVRFGQPQQHLFHVEMSIPNFTSGTKIAMPAWNALYQVRDFAYRVRDVSAVESVAADPGKGPAPQLLVAKLDKQTWQLDYPPAANPSKLNPDAVITYSVVWDDPGPFNSQLDAHHAFINLAEILMYLPDRRSEDTRVSFEEVPAGWSIAVELAGGPGKDTFVAPGYDSLVDAPVEAGKFQKFEFDDLDAHFRVIVDAAGSWNRELLDKGLHGIVDYELRLMGGAPFKRYTFFFHIGPFADVGGGGMEHSNSTAIAGASVENIAAIAAHEFFHAWNVKRIRPQSLEPVDYTKEQYTRALWFAEGVTNTYAAYTLERAGFFSKTQFYANLASQISAVDSRPAHEWQSVEEASLDAWFEKYDGYNTPDRSISYYDKGQVLGVLLDLSIRDATNNRKSLDDVLRRMNDEYARRGKFYNDSDGIRAVIEQVAGRSFEDFFRRYVSGTDPIPYNDILGFAGLELKKSGNDGGESGMDTHDSISEIPHASGRQRRIREGILQGTTD